MSREKGTVTFSGNFDIQKSAPLDAREVVDNYNDLIAIGTWTSLDNNVYTYPGMRVSVVNDEDPTKNGIYLLSKLPATISDNWIKQLSEGNSVTIASDEDYIEGIATDKVPSVSQVKLDLALFRTELDLLTSNSELRGILRMVLVSDTNEYGDLDLTISEDRTSINIPEFSAITSKYNKINIPASTFNDTDIENSLLYYNNDTNEVGGSREVILSTENLSVNDLPLSTYDNKPKIPTLAETLTAPAIANATLTNFLAGTAGFSWKGSNGQTIEFLIPATINDDEFITTLSLTHVVSSYPSTGYIIAIIGIDNTILHTYRQVTGSGTNVVIEINRFKRELKSVKITNNNTGSGTRYAGFNHMQGFNAIVIPDVINIVETEQLFQTNIIGKNSTDDVDIVLLGKYALDENNLVTYVKGYRKYPSSY